jgi:hypothetical protein
VDDQGLRVFVHANGIFATTKISEYRDNFNSGVGRFF